jgi:hypothetical protein
LFPEPANTAMRGMRSAKSAGKEAMSFCAQSRPAASTKAWDGRPQESEACLSSSCASALEANFIA